ncbi:MAG: AAA family ATPase [Pseudonocardia sp.]|uniref:ATP-binding protein n=1 Tax=unclassified Pseudonocardia TaxID=2619320 RepID=UPI000A455A28|nr:MULTISPECIES: AAA family ATPase [unclassified Pseudonocardia]MBN9111206.1 AAA family ATPase [Pseudonocardia sp.]
MTAILPPVLHGRESEQRELLAAAAAAFAAGRSTSALVVGDAGIGKTRLAAEVADRLRDDGVRVAWAACRADGGAPPYWPVAQLLGTLGRADALDVAPAAEPEFARFLLFDAVAAALREAGPLLAVVDDLQWADLPTLRLLAALRAHLAAAPVVLVATVRESDPAAPQALGGLVADRHIVLRGLAAPDLAPVLAELTGVELDAVDAADLHARTGGNPFFAAEVVRMRRAGREDGVPGGVRAVLDRRLDGLPDGTEAVLRAAAALDAGVTAGVDATLLARVAGLALGTLAAEAGPATAAGLLRDDGGRYRFPHALVAETVAARTTPGERLDLHRRAASVLAVRRKAGTATAADVAHQVLAAARLSGEPGEVRAAAEAAEAAAMHAAAATAYEDAVTWLDAALAVSSGDDADPEGRRAALLCARGEALLAAGDPVASRESFAAAGTLARALGRADLLATAALGRTGGATGFEVDLVDPDRVVILDEARAALPADDSVLRTAVTARLSVALAFTAGEGRRRGLAEDAVATARRLGDARALAGALAAWCDAAAGPEHVADRRAAATEIVAIARVAGDRAAELLGRRLRLVALAEAGEWAGVDVEIDAYARVAEAVRRPDLAWPVPLWRGTRATMRGDDEAADTHAAELHRLTASSHSANAELLGLTQEFVRAGLDGRAVGTVGRFLELAPESVAAAHCTIALLHAWSGSTTEAGSALWRYLTSRPGADAGRDSEWLPEVVQAAQTAVLIADHDAARQLRTVLEPFTGLFVIEGILAGTWGCVDAHLGRLAALLGDDAAARRHLSAAVRLDAGAGTALGERTRRWAAATGTAPVAATVPDRLAGTADDATFRRDGEVWTITWHGREVRLRDSKGLRDLAVLLARPGQEIAVHQLTGARVAATPVELSDRTAVDAYRARLRDLAAEIDDAEACHDDARGARAASEREALLAELGAVTGLGGRTRTAGSDVERMRKAVGNRLRQALARIDAADPDLGRHLAVSVRTGTFCRYAPDREVHWRF